MTAGSPTVASASFTRVADSGASSMIGLLRDVVQEVAGLVLLVAQFALHGHAARHVEADLHHGAAEQFAVFGLVDGLGRGADQLDVVFLEHAALAQGQRRVQRGLAAHGGQQREHAARRARFPARAR